MTGVDVPIRRLDERVVFENNFGRLCDDVVEWPSGRRGHHLRLRSGDGSPGVVVVPRFDGTFGLVRVFRYPLGLYQWGFPRGMAHSADPLQSARVELAEEMGLDDADFALVGWFTPDSGIQEGRVAVVLADVTNPRGVVADRDEVSAVRWVGYESLAEELANDPWSDGMTLASLALLALRRLL